jgi:hypothetical protein
MKLLYLNKLHPKKYKKTKEIWRKKTYIIHNIRLGLSYMDVMSYMDVTNGWMCPIRRTWLIYSLNIL